MGRELRRVPLDFKWPREMVWKGYLNPFHAQECKACSGEGLNPATKQLSDDFYDFAKTGRRWCAAITQDEVDALIAENRLWDFWRRVGPNGWEDVEPRPVVTAAMVNAANQAGGFLAHDAINRWILIETRAKRLGVWGKCEFCHGEGVVWQSRAVKRLHDEWKPFDPPTGPGFQLWETTSEGSPVSPVFETLEALCAWCEAEATTFGRARTTAAEWRRMLEAKSVAHVEGNNVFF